MQNPYHNMTLIEGMQALERAIWNEIQVCADHFELILRQKDELDIQINLSHFIADDVKPAFATADEAEAVSDAWDRSQMLALRNVQ